MTYIPTPKRTTSTLLFLRRGDELLLARKKRSHGQGKWNGVGGKPEANETIEHTAVRECQEEIGVTPVVFEAVAELAFYQEPYVDSYSNMDVTVFICTKWEGEPIETEEMAPKWFKITDIPYKDMWPDDQHWLPPVIDGKFVTGTFMFNDKYQLTSHNVTAT
ncbi:MAG: 8-oxo-dGTP diphosphatase [Candidatus Saccharimonas sp.]